MVENASAAAVPLLSRAVVQLGNSFTESEEYRVIVARIQPMLDALMERKQSAGYVVRQKNISYPTNFLWQVCFLELASYTVLFIHFSLHSWPWYLAGQFSKCGETP